MAGGNITRIVGGKNLTETEEWTVFTDKFTAYAGKGSHFTADKGTFIGDPNDPPTGKKYFEKGYWTNDKGKRIKEAKLGDKVQFHLKMRNIFPKTEWKNEKVELQLREFDGNIPNILLYIITFGLKDVKEHDKIFLSTKNEQGESIPFNTLEINPKMEMVIDITLVEEAMTQLIKNDTGRNGEKFIELYFNFVYHSEREHETEVVDLPIMESDYLVVKPGPIVEPIVFVEASSTHPLPAIYSAEDGSPWYVNIMSPEAYKEIKKIPEDAKDMAEKLEMVYDYFLKTGGGSFEPDEINKWTKRSYEIAIRKLSKGELIFTDGTRGASNRLHRYTVSDIDGQYSSLVMMGVNRGKFKKGISSKGINQLEAQSNRGISKTFKTIGEIAPVWDTLCDLADILISAANGERPALPFTPPFVTMQAERFWADVDEVILRQWDKELQTAIQNGPRAVKDVISSNINAEYNLGFNFINVSEGFLNKILKKEISEYDKSSADFESYIINQSEGKKDAAILVQKIQRTDTFNRQTFFHYIHAIYLKDLKI